MIVFSKTNRLLLLLVAAIDGTMVRTASASDTTSTTTTVPEGGTQYRHFIAMNETMTCLKDEHALLFNNQVRGVNLGGWMVLEPWITPSLFYQFLGNTNQNEIAMDTYTFCKVLGPEKANLQLRKHWETFVTKEIIGELAMSGINSLRLPVGDYMYKPYGPYMDGCFDGALEHVFDLLDWATKYGLTVLIDIHTMKDSQNGFDNSGQQTFEHWPIRDARWIGTFDQDSASYSSIKDENLQHALDVIEAVVDQHKYNPAVEGIEPVNEPWQYTPIEALKRFYWEGYLIVKRTAPHWKYVMHDSFRLDPSIWGGFMAGCPERALDTHIYQAWKNPDSRIGFFQDACNNKKAILALEQEFGPVIVGEWSLATDNRAMWLNGFNDNLPEFPRSAPHNFDDTDNVMRLLAYKKISAYSAIGHGFYFWNFRTELDEPDWSYLLALERGWIPQGHFNDPKIQNACRSEDEMAYNCYLKNDMPENRILKAVDYILKQKNETATTFEETVANMEGDALFDAANGMIADYFEANKVVGVTCDFGGVAMLVEESRTITDGDFIDWDAAYLAQFENPGPSWWQLTRIILFGTLIGSVIGFMIGMRFNRKFNQVVQKSEIGKRMSMAVADNATLRHALSLGDLGDLDFDAIEDDGETVPLTRVEMVKIR